MSKYRSYPRDEGEDIRMASGRLVTEVSYTVPVVEYTNDYVPDAIFQPALTALLSGDAIDVEYLPDDGSGELRRGFFKCTKRPTRYYAFERGGKVFWRDISFTLEGVEGID